MMQFTQPNHPRYWYLVAHSRAAVVKFRGDPRLQLPVSPQEYAFELDNKS